MRWRQPGRKYRAVSGGPARWIRPDSAMRASTAATRVSRAALRRAPMAATTSDGATGAAARASAARTARIWSRPSFAGQAAAAAGAIFGATSGSASSGLGACRHGLRSAQPDHRSAHGRVPQAPRRRAGEHRRKGRLRGAAPGGNTGPPRRHPRCDRGAPPSRSFAPGRSRPLPACGQPGRPPVRPA